MIEQELRVQIRHHFFADHWKIGTIATELKVHPDTVRRAIEVERFQGGAQLRASHLDPYLPFLRETLEAHPRLCATRLHRMISDRGYTGSIRQLRRAVAPLRPRRQEVFLRTQVFAGEDYGKFRVMVRIGGDLRVWERISAGIGSWCYITPLQGFEPVQETR